MGAVARTVKLGNALKILGGRFATPYRNPGIYGGLILKCILNQYDVRKRNDINCFRTGINGELLRTRQYNLGFYKRSDIF